MLFFVLLAGSLALLLVFLLGHGAKGRRAGFFGSIVCVLLAVLCISMAAWQKSEFLDTYEAIVMRAVSTVRSSPGGEGSKDLFVLLARNRLVADWQKRNQLHSRKFHAYFIVFQKCDIKIKYTEV